MQNSKVGDNRRTFGFLAYSDIINRWMWAGSSCHRI